MKFDSSKVSMDSVIEALTEVGIEVDDAEITDDSVHMVDENGEVIVLPKDFNIFCSQIEKGW